MGEFLTDFAIGKKSDEGRVCGMVPNRVELVGMYWQSMMSLPLGELLRYLR